MAKRNEQQWKDEVFVAWLANDHKRMQELNAMVSNIRHTCGNVAEIITGSGNGQEWLYCPTCKVEFHVTSVRKA